jgi:polysaccharide chain length determinant protein (PEP-CTERM system associated)
MTEVRSNPQTTATPLGIILLRFYERRWLIAACLVLGWAVGTAVAWILAPKYRSETVILIEQQKVPEHYVESNITADLQQRLQSMSEQILSRTRLLSLIDKFNLYGGNASHHPDPDALVERMRNDIKIEMITAEGRPGQLSAFKISYSAATPMLAREVTKEITSLFINENLQNREQSSEDTTSFLQSQLNEARQSLTEQEEKLRQFRTQHPGELPEQLQGNLQILGGLQLQLQAANDALSQAEQHSLYLRSLLHQYQKSGQAGASDRPGSGLNSTLNTQAQLAALRAQLSDLQSRYTERYPDILRVKQQIAELEAQRARESASSPGETVSAADDVTGPAVSSSDASPVIQLSGELSANELQIKNEKAKIKRLEEQIEIYQSRLNSTPAREQEAAAVTRDYDQSRTYYETLLSKKLQSEMATNLEKRRQGEQFRIIDPPSLPKRPYWPNRLAFSFGGLATGLAIGLAIAMLLDLLTPRLTEESELTEFIGSGYTLVIPSFATEQELALTRRQRVLEAVAASLLAAIIPAVTLLATYRH